MKKVCDSCGKAVKDAGKLFRVGFLTLCKKCRSKKNRMR